MASRYLATYLNDHLAGATGGLELARRAARENDGTDLGAFLAALASEIETDRDALKDVMARLGVGTDRLKVLVGWTAEKVGRLKPNAQLRGYSPLSPLVELEGLALGIEGKLMLWRALEALGDERLAEAGLDELAARAQRQRADLERRRIEVARRAIADS